MENFTDDFQDLILAIAISDPEKILKYGSVLKPQYFQGVQAVLTANSMLNYYEKYHRFPTWTVLEQVVIKETARFEGQSDRAVEYVKKLKSLNTADSDYVVDKIVEFARERAVKAAVLQSIEEINAGDFSKIIPTLETALSVGQNLHDLGFLFKKDYETAVDLITKQSYGIHTGYTHLDNVWKQGWGPGWLIVPLAPPKRYKSSLCLNLAMHMISPPISKNVFYYTCEISQELAVMRCLCNLTGKSPDFLFQRPDQLKLLAKEKMKELVGADLLIKGFPSKSATIQDIRNHAKTAIKQLGIVPSAIFIDYAETVKPMRASKMTSEWSQSASIYTDARAFAMEMNCPIIMPDRCNRDTVGKNVPSMKSFQGAFEKAGIVDVAIGLCATDSEAKQNILRFFVFLNRHGAAYQHFGGVVDPESFHIEINEVLEYNPDSEEDYKRRSPKVENELPY